MVSRDGLQVSCRKALDSLQTIDPTQAAPLKREFQGLVTTATQYGGVRDQVGETTRQTIDAMYQFRTLRLCAEINQSLMDSLVKQGATSVR
ncbi:permease [Klebsiella aerogenes]|uniref:permease n=1 Tax=Klebsiella aerogenes TaxID=548 RepID=UPI0034D176AF